MDQKQYDGLTDWEKEEVDLWHREQNKPKKKMYEGRVNEKFINKRWAVSIPIHEYLEAGYKIKGGAVLEICTYDISEKERRHQPMLANANNPHLNDPKQYSKHDRIVINMVPDQEKAVVFTLCDMNDSDKFAKGCFVLDKHETIYVYDHEGSGNAPRSIIGEAKVYQEGPLIKGDVSFFKSSVHLDGYFAIGGTITDISESKITSFDLKEVSIVPMPRTKNCKSVREQVKQNTKR